MYRLFFEGPVIFFYRLGGGVEDFWENTWLDEDGGGGGRIICRQKSIKLTIEN